MLVVGGGLDLDAELYNPTSNSWSLTQSPIVRTQLDHTATLLQSGQVLVVGGTGVGGTLGSAQVYNPATRNWSYAGSPNTPRFSHNATLLPNGKVLISGGFNATTPLDSAELYDPSTNKWSYTGSLHQARAEAAAVLLPGGRFVILGGFVRQDPRFTKTVETYDTPAADWGQSADMVIARLRPVATILQVNHVLVTGGCDLSTGASLASAEIR